MAKVLLVRLKAFDHKRRASPCAKMTGDKVSPERAKAFALSGRKRLTKQPLFNSS